MTINIEGISEPVEIIRSSRKTIGVTIDKSGKIIARVPMKISEEYVVNFLISKKKWIEEHIRKVRENKKMLEAVTPLSAEEIQEMAEKALKIIPERVKYYAPLVGVTYGRITIRNQKTRWGSCSSKGNLNFNCLLVLTPPQVMDSVVVHELCHRKHMDHSKAFYAEVYRVFPEYDKWNKWLKEHGPELIHRMTGG